MSFTEDLLRVTTSLEVALKRRGATGTGLVELAMSIRRQLGQETISRIERLGRVRNALVHEPEFRFEEDESAFINSARDLLADVSGPAHRNQAMEKIPMDGDTSWCTIRRNDVVGHVFEGTPLMRLVLIQGGVPRVMPVGRHRAWPLQGIEAAGWVNMAPQRCIFSVRNLMTFDEILFDADVATTLRVVDHEDAIAAITLGAESKQSVAFGVVERVLRAAVAGRRSEDVMRSRTALIAEVLAGARNVEHERSSGFHIIDIDLRLLQHADGELAAHRTTLARLRARGEAMAVEREQAELERLGKSLVAQAEHRAALRRKAEEQLLALSFVQLQHRHEMEFARERASVAEAPSGLAGLDPALYAELKRCELKAVVDLARAEGDDLRAFVKQIAQGVAVGHEAHLLGKLLQRTYGVRFTANDTDGDASKTRDEDDVP